MNMFIEKRGNEMKKTIFGGKMKNVKMLLGLILVIFLSNCAQIPITVMPVETKPLVSVSNTEFENDFLASGVLQGSKFTFDKKIKWLKIDPIQNHLLIFIQKTGENPRKKAGSLILYDINNQEIIWSVLAFADKGEITSKIILISGYGKTFGLDRKSGSVIWERVGNYYNLGDINEVAYSGQITQFDVNTGLDIWSRELTNKWGINATTIVDSTLIIALDGLHTFDLKTGLGWDITMETGWEDHGKEIAKEAGKILAGALIGALTGYMPVDNSTYSPDRYTSLCSNVYIHNDEIYFFAKDQFIRVDIETGSKLWCIAIDEKTGKVYLDKEDKNIVFLSKGQCLKDWVNVSYGEPYLAKFDILTGEKKFSMLIDSENPIVDWKISSNGYYLISEKKLQYYDKNGMKISELTLPSEYGVFSNFSRNLDKLLIIEDNKILDLFAIDNIDSHIIVKTSKGIAVISENFEIENWYPESQIYYKSKTKNNLCFVKGNDDKKIKLVDLKKKKLIGELSASSYLYLLDNVICYISQNNLNYIPISAVSRNLSEK